MNCIRLKLLFSVLLIFIIGIVLNTSVFAGGSFTIKWGKDEEPEKRQVYHKKKKGGPPPHAPAHGYRAKRQYRYYPDQKVYHDAERGLYFYLKGDNWEVGASLPSPLRTGLGESVTIELDTDKPYVHNSEHIKRYPPGKAKNKKKNKWG